MNDNFLCTRIVGMRCHSRIWWSPVTTYNIHNTIHILYVVMGPHQIRPWHLIPTTYTGTTSFSYTKVINIKYNGIHITQSTNGYVPLGVKQRYRTCMTNLLYSSVLGHVLQSYCTCVQQSLPQTCVQHSSSEGHFLI